MSVKSSFPKDADVHAFVLRFRADKTRRPIRVLVDLDDVTASKTWLFTSLEEAFDQIKASLKLHGDIVLKSDKPH